MAGITLQIAQSHLDTWLAAEEAVSLGQSFAHKGNALTRADLAVIGSRIDYWNKHVERLTRGSGIAVQRIILNG